MLNSIKNKIISWKTDKNQKWLVILICLTFLSALSANLLQSNFGTIEISEIKVVDENGNTITGKLYRPLTATKDTPAPGVIACHGMNNDKDTEAPVALELAKRGIVVLSVDQLNHGDSDLGMNVIGGFLLGEGDEDDSLGANSMYIYLKNTDFVDGNLMGLIGHSMGGGTVRTIARLNPDHKAIIIQASGLDNFTETSWLNNYLNIWPRYEELFTNSMEPRDDFLERGKQLIEQNLQIIGESPKGDVVNENYGDFSTGTAQRYASIDSTHPGATWNSISIQESVAWMIQSFGLESDQNKAMQMSQSQSYQLKETFTLLSLLACVFSTIPFIFILLEKTYFVGLIETKEEKVFFEKKEWWKHATKSTIIGGILFIFLPGIGMLLFGALTLIFPVFRLLTGNGAVFWLLIMSWICASGFKKWYAKTHPSQPIDFEEFGGISKGKNDGYEEYIKKSLILATITFAYLLILITIIQNYILVELRYMWPVLKGFTALRFIQFLLYLIPVYIFFKWNAGLSLFGQMRMPKETNSLKTHLIWWLKSMFLMEAGLLLIFLIQYLPMFLFQTGPGLSFGLLGMVFGLYGIFLMQILPQFAVIFLLLIVFYQKTEKIYVGSFICTMLTAWILAVSGMLI